MTAGVTKPGSCGGLVTPPESKNGKSVPSEGVSAKKNIHIEVRAPFAVAKPVPMLDPVMVSGDANTNRPETTPTPGPAPPPPADTEETATQPNRDTDDATNKFDNSYNEFLKAQRKETEAVSFQPRTSSSHCVRVLTFLFVFVPDQAMARLNLTHVKFTMIANTDAVIASASANPMTVGYAKTKAVVERKFFDIIAKESVLSILSHYDFDFERVFYRQLNGDKTERKKLTLNNCILHRKDRKFRQPNSVTVELKMLFARFKEHVIMLLLSTDFWFKGSFSSYLQLVWNEKNEQDAMFGNWPTRQNVMPEDY
jgi:hypothetical protein